MLSLKVAFLIFFLFIFFHLLIHSKNSANRIYWTIACYAIQWNVHSGFDVNKLFIGLEIVFAEPRDKNLKNLISIDLTSDFYMSYKVTPNHYLKEIIFN